MSVFASGPPGVAAGVAAEVTGPHARPDGAVPGLADYAADCAAVRAELAALDPARAPIVIPDTTVTLLDGMSTYGD